MRVVICGAGIGGLTLAQTLRDDVELTVLDRDPSAELVAMAVAALRRWHGWLPPLIRAADPDRVIRALRNPVLSAAARPGMALAGRRGRMRYAGRSRPRSASG